MRTLITLNKYQETDNGTDIMITVPGHKLGDMLCRKHIKQAEIRFDDGRHISAEQRKKHMLPSEILRTIPVISRKNKRNGLSIFILFGLVANILAFRTALWIWQGNLLIQFLNTP